jgi:hypothetical protein
MTDIAGLAWADGYREGIRDTLLLLLNEFGDSLPETVALWVEQKQDQLEVAA